MMRTWIVRSAIFTGLIIACMALAPLLAGCGEAAAERQVGEMLEKAMESEGGGDVDVVISGDDSGSISISGDDGNASMSFGGSADVPEGFPKDLLPDDADVQSAMTFSENDASMDNVSFTSKKGLDDMYQWYLDALPNAGYTVENKLQFDSDGSKTFTIISTGSNNDCTVSGTEGDDGTVYTISVVTK